MVNAFPRGNGRVTRESNVYRIVGPEGYDRVTVQRNNDHVTIGVLCCFSVITDGLLVPIAEQFLQVVVFGCGDVCHRVIIGDAGALVNLLSAIFRILFLTKSLTSGECCVMIRPMG